MKHIPLVIRAQSFVPLTPHFTITSPHRSLSTTVISSYSHPPHYLVCVCLLCRTNQCVLYSDEASVFGGA